MCGPSGAASVTAPAFVLAGHAPGAFSLRNGYGRGRGGTMGNGLGASAYVLMAEPGRFVVAVETMKEGSPVSVHTPQDQFASTARIATSTQASR